MGVELELFLLLVLFTLGSSIFAVFEVETPWWRKALKLFIVPRAAIGSAQVHHRFFVVTSGVMLAIALVGFSPSFFLKVLYSTVP